MIYILLIVWVIGCLLVWSLCAINHKQEPKIKRVK